MVAIWSDPGVVRHIGGRAFDAAETAARLERYLGMWAALGHGYWAIEDRASGQYLGEAGLARFGRGLGPGFDDWPEAGWVLAARAQGRGLGTETVAAVLGWADGPLAADRTVCVIRPGNVPSLRLAARFGYGVTEEAALDGAAVVLLARGRGGVALG